MRAGRRLRDGDLAVLHRGIGPGHAAAGKHRDRDVLRRRVARDADVEALRANGRDRHHADAQGQVEVLPHPGRGLGERLARQRPGAAAPRSSRRRRRTRRESRGPPSALVTATITAAPAMFTAL